MKKIAILIILSILLVSVLYFIYPAPRFFWNLWHYNDYAKIQNISTDLKSQQIFAKRIKCWDISHNCGVEIIFVTSLTLEEVKSYINNLNWEQKLTREIDGKGIYTALDFSSVDKFELNGTEFNAEKNFISAKEPASWGWWLISPDEDNYLINFFEWSSTGDEIVIDGSTLEGNVVTLILQTRGM